MKSWQSIQWMFVALWSAASLHAAAVHYVTMEGNEANSGASWAAAKRSIAATLAIAQSGDEVWVAQGIYREHLQLRGTVGLYGGFAGSEQTRGSSTLRTYSTVLDGTTNGIPVTLINCAPDTVLDGFTIMNGSGPGVYCWQTAGIVRNCTVRGNVSSDASAYGAGILVWGASTNGIVVLEGNRITDNASFDGGGIACIDASPRIQGNVICWNLAYQNGGGISCWRNSSPLIANNVLVGNTASWLVNTPVPVGGGAIFATADDLDGRPHPTAVCAPRLLNNVLAANGARRGGGIAVVDSNGGIPIVVNNTIVANNGSGFYWGSSSLPLVGTKPVIRNNIVAFNTWGLEQAPGTPTTSTIDFNCIYGNQLQGTPTDFVGLMSLTGTNGNFSRDPGLVNLEFGNLHLQAGSPCTDAGTPPHDAVTETDIDGQSRLQGQGIDLGADESDGTWLSPLQPIFHVNPRGSDQSDGLTWSNAKGTVQAALNAARQSGGEVWVARGTYFEHIVLPAFVHVYGGFSGTETNRELRQIADNPTILDGQGRIKVVLCGNGGYLVSRLDGFTIQNGGKFTGGAGLSQYGPGGLGGGIYLGVSSPFIVNNTITRNSLAHDNSASFPQPASYGAGIYCELSYAIISGNTIRQNEILNTFDGSGAGLYCSFSSPVIQDNTFQENHARYGSAVFGVATSPILRNNLIESNAMYNTYPLPLYLGSVSGAITLQQGEHALIEGNIIRANSAAAGAGIYLSGFATGRIQNNVMVGNRAEDPMGTGGLGGGLYCLVMTNATEPLWILHNTVIGNTASTPFGEQGGAIAFSLPPPANQLVIANNLMVSNTSGIYQTPTTPMARPTLTHNLLLNSRSNYINLAQGSTDFSAKPRFRDAEHGDYRLEPGSPGIDAGDAAYAPAIDLDGKPRPLDGNADGVALPDVGAFEYLLELADSDSDGMTDGWEWAHGLAPSQNDAVSDWDGDGFNNYAEFIAGTDPALRASVLKLEAVSAADDGQLRLRWACVPDRVYLIESCNLVSGIRDWQPVGGTVRGTNDFVEFVVSTRGEQSKCFRSGDRAWHSND